MELTFRTPPVEPFTKGQIELLLKEAITYKTLDDLAG
jgi:hypothetical protein